ncbi:MAG: hypothetical protein ABI584_11440 [Acidobacteriota bacterium]
MSEVRIYRRISSYSKCPGWLVLLALGWRIEAIDERYFSVLLSRAERPEPEVS